MVKSELTSPQGQSLPPNILLDLAVPWLPWPTGFDLLKHQPEILVNCYEGDVQDLQNPNKTEQKHTKTTRGFLGCWLEHQWTSAKAVSARCARISLAAYSKGLYGHASWETWGLMELIVKPQESRNFGLQEYLASLRWLNKAGAIHGIDENYSKWSGLLRAEHTLGLFRILSRVLCFCLHNIQKQWGRLQRQNGTVYWRSKTTHDTNLESF